MTTKGGERWNLHGELQIQGHSINRKIGIIGIIGTIESIGTIGTIESIEKSNQSKNRHNRHNRINRKIEPIKMCGIAGYWQKNGSAEADTLLAMTRRVAPRGPDGEGYWLWDGVGRRAQAFAGADSPAAVAARQARLLPGAAPVHQLAFGHRRYAVIDPSPGGHQPMQRDGLTLAYNGELYNYQALRHELAAAGAHFHSGADAEVVLAAYQHWGLGCLSRFRGFFALALHDADRDQLLLARDPLGKAGLYLLQKPEAWFFASNIEPILDACPEERLRLRPEAGGDFLHHNLRDFGHRTFWANIASVPSGSWLRLDLRSGLHDSGRYWQLPEQRLSPRDLSLEEAAAQLRQLLGQALERRLVGEQPIGFTLSGGLDSSALLALYAQQPRPQRVPVFTVRYADPRHDESAFARAVVARYPQHFEHVFLDGFAQTLADDWDAFVAIQEEPFHDPALYTDYFQQKMLKQRGIGVTLNGAGGDETLAGYPAYLPAHLRWLRQQPGPGKYGQMAADVRSVLENLPPDILWAIARKRLGCEPPLPHLAFIRLPDPADKPFSSDFDTVLRQRMGDWLMHYWLRSQHKNFMHIPVEPRMPFLDLDWVDFCFRLPAGYLIRNGWLKYPLRLALRGLLPDAVLWRKRKVGFPFDTGAWLRTHGPALQALLRRDAGNPWMDGPGAAAAYHTLLHRDAQLLWRMVSLSLWHLRVIQGEKRTLA
jgi:asparagine synthase (glutamine-hydrolysing)